MCTFLAACTGLRFLFAKQLKNWYKKKAEAISELEKQKRRGCNEATRKEILRKCQFISLCMHNALQLQ